MVITSHQRYELKKFVAELKPKRGRHTELVSVYIPQGYDIIKVIQQLQDEQGTATNIKSASTRNNVLDALERMVQHLKLYKATPNNGLAAFSGNVSEREGVSDVRVWSIEPPIPNKLRLYRCDKGFVLEPIEEMLESDEEWGLVVMDNRDATIGLLKGKSIQILVKTHSEVPGKIKAGGQSAFRFSQNRELAANAHYKKVADYMKDQFLPRLNLKGILIGGPGPNKYKLAEGGFLTGDVQKKVLAVKDIGDTGESGLNELVDRSQDLLAEAEIADEKKVVNRFLELLATDDARVKYGRDDCLHALEAGAVDLLLLSEANDDRTIEEFEAVAKNYGTTVKIISTETREGAQLRDLGKLAAILRYRLAT